MAILPPDFYQGRDTPTIARDLLGKLLVHATADGLTSGVIVETEAYLAQGDPASHSFRGLTPRNRPMYGPAGTSYIYISYGLHRCFNVVCQPAGVAEAVLIRGLRPEQGMELMRQRRHQVADNRLTNGPGKVCQALGIELRQNGHPLQQPPLYVLDGSPPVRIVATPRVGISQGQELLLRFVAEVQ